MQEVVKSRERAAFIAVLALLGLSYSGVARANSYNIVYQGQSATQGILAVDSAGNLYVEVAPGTSDAGSVLRLNATSGFSRAKLLYVFGNGGAADGNNPMGGPTPSTRYGVLGTTSGGGVDGDGTVFTLGEPKKITFTALHAFSGAQTKPEDGAVPESGLTHGLFNEYYGTTTAGGANNAGTVFSVSGSAADPKYSILHSFGQADDGINPETGRLAVDSKGRLYGVTAGGGANKLGVLFMMKYVSGGWQEQVLYSFNDNLMSSPRGNIVLDSNGNVYGCGGGRKHTVTGLFQVSPPEGGKGTWIARTLYTFGTQAHDPSPLYGCNVAIDPATDLIVGTSGSGGLDEMGTIFTLTPPGTAGWTETVVHSFSGGADGATPTSPPLEVGGTYYGGNSTNGAIYAFTP